MTITRRWARDPRVLVDLVVAAVVAVLSVVEVAIDVRPSRCPGERPADALAYALVVAGVGRAWCGDDALRSSSSRS